VIIRNSILGIPGNEEVEVDALAQETEGFNGADVEYLCEKAKEIAIRRVIAGSMKNKKFTKEDFDQALKEVRSSVAKKDISRLENWEKENVKDAV
jgi:SpoVK/Ycf46/Vps4 family AAA+-type ATPase